MSKRTLQLFESALRLSAHVLQREPDQLAGQLSGRLRLSDLGLDRVTVRRSWLRPLTPSILQAVSLREGKLVSQSALTAIALSLPSALRERLGSPATWAAVPGGHRVRHCGQ